MKSRPHRLSFILVIIARALWSGEATAAAPAEPPLRVALVGDSTVAKFPADSPIHGWGEFIPARMRARVQVENFGRSGASSASFLAEGHWDAVVAQRPAIVLLQFGHNDFLRDVPAAGYAANLQTMVGAARKFGAVPIVITPVHLLKFDGDRLVPALVTYAEAARAVAARSEAPLIDLNALSRELFTRLGPARTAQLASPNGDHTHFNRLGAQAIAEIILRALGQLNTPLRREIIAVPPAPESRLRATPIPIAIGPRSVPATPANRRRR